MIKVRPRPREDEIDAIAVTVSLDKLNNVVISKSLHILNVRALKERYWLGSLNALSREFRPRTDVLQPLATYTGATKNYSLEYDGTRDVF